MKINNCKALTVLFFAMTLATSETLKAAKYQFSIGGFNGGITLGNELIKSSSNGRISGSFEGEDTNGDGFISGDLTNGSDIPSEVSVSSLTYTGDQYFNGEARLDRDTALFTYDIRNRSLKLDVAMDFFLNIAEFNQATGLEADVSGEGVLSYFRLLLNGSGGYLSVYPDSFYAQDKTGNFYEINGFHRNGPNPIDPELPPRLHYSIDFTSAQQATVSEVPLPGALLLFMTGLGGLGAFARKHN